jgi:hypothetical protein
MGQLLTMGMTLSRHKLFMLVNNIHRSLLKKFSSGLIAERIRVEDRGSAR